jgi:hypothetical protein
VAGAEGVRHAIGILRSEIHRNMALLGINRLDELDASLVRDLQTQAHAGPDFPTAPIGAAPKLVPIRHSR